MSHAVSGSVCALVGYQWCVVPCFVGATMSKVGCRTRIPMRGRHGSLWSESMLYRQLIFCWHFTKASKC